MQPFVDFPKFSLSSFQTLPASPIQTVPDRFDRGTVWRVELEKPSSILNNRFLAFEQKRFFEKLFSVPNCDVTFELERLEERRGLMGYRARSCILNELNSTGFTIVASPYRKSLESSRLKKPSAEWKWWVILCLNGSIGWILWMNTASAAWKPNRLALNLRWTIVGPICRMFSFISNTLNEQKMVFLCRKIRQMCLPVGWLSDSFSGRPYSAYLQERARIRLRIRLRLRQDNVVKGNSKENNTTGDSSVGWLDCSATYDC